MFEDKVAVIGLGYVGLPLASLLATKHRVVGFDIRKERVDQLSNGIDTTLEVSTENLKSILLNDRAVSEGITFTNDVDKLKDCKYYIITVPTPVDKNNRPDLTPLLMASGSVGRVLKKGDVVIYESTVYPGATEEDCVPILERTSGLRLNKDFYAGYSPERINPGDKEHTVDKILKITSGSNDTAARLVDHLYKSVITAGTYLAPSIKVAEAAKVIENSQRDINIAFVNELAKLFNLMNLDTSEVLKAASTKWNFLPFKPGLVGGHCIGVDPYYLAQKAQECGYHPEIILAGRRINDSMGPYIASQLVKLMIRKDIRIKGAQILVLGITFKENCPDVRNTKVVDIVSALDEYGVDLTIYDPWAKKEDVYNEYQLESLKKLPNKRFDAIILAVAHNEFQDICYSSIRKENGVIYDVKGFLPPELVDARI